MNIMKKFFLLSTLFSSIIFQTLQLQAQGYNIKVKIPALKDSTLYFGHYLAKAGVYVPNDTLKLNKTGEGIFKNAKALPKGFYIILLPSKKYFDVIIGTDQVFNITVTDTANLLSGVKFEGSDENRVMTEYRSLIADRSAKVGKLSERKKASTSAQQKDSITKAIDAIHKEVLAYIDKTKKENASLFFIKFVTSIEEIKVPDPPRDSQGRITDSLFQYRYYRKHYFDNFNIGDPDLLRTMYYDQKVMDYIDKVVPQMPDTLMIEIDNVMERVKNEPELFRYVLGTLYNKYASSQIMGHDGVFVHLAEKWYLPYATWSDSTFKANLKKDIAKVKPNIIGNVAPNMTVIEIPAEHFMIAKNDTALKSDPNVGQYIRTNDIQARFLVIMFWEADCGHCKKAVPEMHEIFQRLKDKDVKVAALHMISSIEGKRKWVDFVNEHQLYDWINVWSPTNHDFRERYNVYSTPVIYVLDKNKKILAKRLAPDQVEEVINFEIKREQNSKKQ
jgi:thiol-disulfide isomerase/thioredoxin